MYQALYRKWRPQTFDQVVGQKHITETLKNQVKTGRLSHAYIFIGTRGTGKTTCARILARAVNCEHPVDGNPCGKCASCRGIAEGSVMDVVELDAASNNGVENVRALREEAVFSPTSVKKRVYIVDEVHMLSTSAFNALLKILEEPPEHLMFILATTELQKVPATILSRCQRHSFRRIDTPEIAEYLEYIAKQEQFRLNHDAAELIARLAEGGVRDALSLLDQCSAREEIDVDAVYSAMGLAGNRRIAQLLGLILDRDTQRALKSFESLWMDGKDPATLLGELAGLLRDSLMFRVAPKGALELVSGSYDGETLRAFSKRLTTEELLSSLDSLQRAQASMKDVKNPKLTAELTIVSLCQSPAGESLGELRARISRLEEQLRRGEALAPAPGGEALEREPEDRQQPEPEPPEEYYEDMEPPPKRQYGGEEPEELDPLDFVEEQPEDSKGLNTPFLLTLYGSTQRFLSVKHTPVFQSIRDLLDGKLDGPISVRYAKLATLLAGIVAIVSGLYGSFIYALGTYGYTICGGVLIPAFVIGLVCRDRKSEVFRSRMSVTAAKIGMTAGVVTAVAFELIPSWKAVFGGGVIPALVVTSAGMLLGNLLCRDQTWKKAQ